MCFLPENAVIKVISPKLVMAAGCYGGKEIYLPGVKALEILTQVKSQLLRIFQHLPLLLVINAIQQVKSEQLCLTPWPE